MTFKFYRTLTKYEKIWRKKKEDVKEKQKLDRVATTFIPSTWRDCTEETLGSISQGFGGAIETSCVIYC